MITIVLLRSTPPRILTLQAINNNNADTFTFSSSNDDEESLVLASNSQNGGVSALGGMFLLSDCACVCMRVRFLLLRSCARACAVRVLVCVRRGDIYHIAALI